MSPKTSMPLMRRLVSSERSERREFKPMSEQDEAENLARIERLVESRIPSHIRHVIHYAHSLTEIYEYYRGFGINMPQELRDEIERAVKIAAQDIKDEQGQGGALHEYYKDKLKESMK